MFTDPRGEVWNAILTTLDSAKPEEMEWGAYENVVKLAVPGTSGTLDDSNCGAVVDSLYG